jgi:hypothetical protein
MYESRKFITVFMPDKFNAIVSQFSPVYTVKDLKIPFNIRLTSMLTSVPSCFKDIQLRGHQQRGVHLSH